MNEPTPDQIQKIAEAIAAGNKIEAIKLHRSSTGSDLMHSKEFIEKLAVELHEQNPAKYAAPKTGKGCLAVLAAFIILLVLASAVKAEEAPAYFPLEKGNFWIYQGEVKFLVKNQTTGTNEVETKTLTWKMEVTDTASRGLVFASKLKGYPSDLAWYEHGKERGDWLIVRIGTGLYHLCSGTEAQTVWDKIKDPGESFYDLVKADSLLFDVPLIEGKTYGEAEQTAVGRYCWKVEGESTADSTAIKGCPKLSDARLFTIAFRTSPDHQIVSFVPGLGIVGYQYVHHGTTSECDLKLVEFGQQQP